MSPQQINQPNYEPSEAEIAAACRRIQATWDEDTELKRTYATPPLPKPSEPAKRAGPSRPRGDLPERQGGGEGGPGGIKVLPGRKLRERFPPPVPAP
jgi:hypothetical protein